MRVEHKCLFFFSSSLHSTTLFYFLLFPFKLFWAFMLSRSQQSLKSTYYALFSAHGFFTLAVLNTFSNYQLRFRLLFCDLLPQHSNVHWAILRRRNFFASLFFSYYVNGGGFWVQCVCVCLSVFMYVNIVHVFIFANHQQEMIIRNERSRKKSGVSLNKHYRLHQLNVRVQCAMFCSINS